MIQKSREQVAHSVGTVAGPCLSSSPAPDKHRALSLQQQIRSSKFIKVPVAHNKMQPACTIIAVYKNEKGVIV